MFPLAVPLLCQPTWNKFWKLENFRFESDFWREFPWDLRHLYYPLWSMTQYGTLCLTVMLHDKCDDHDPRDPQICPRSCPPTMTRHQMVTITLHSSLHSSQVKEQSSSLKSWRGLISQNSIFQYWMFGQYVYIFTANTNIETKLKSKLSWWAEWERKCKGNEVISLMTSYWYCYEANSYFLQHLLFSTHYTK